MENVTFLNFVWKGEFKKVFLVLVDELIGIDYGLLQLRK